MSKQNKMATIGPVLRGRFLCSLWLLILLVSVVLGSALEGFAQSKGKVFRLEDKLKPIRKSSTTKVEQLSTLHKGETYRILAEAKDSEGRTLSWLELAIPTLDNAWVGVQGLKLLPEEEVHELKNFLDFRGQVRGKNASLIVSVKADSPSNIFPLEVILLTGEQHAERRDLGKIEQRDKKKTFELLSSLIEQGKVLILINGKEVLSHRQWIQLKRERPILTVTPAEVVISPYTLGEIEVPVSIYSIEEITKLEYKGSDLLALEPINGFIWRDGIIRFRLNADEWRQLAKRTKPLIGKLLYHTRDGNTGETDVQLFIKEQSSFIVTIRSLLPSFILFFAGALAIMSFALIILKINRRVDSNDRLKLFKTSLHEIEDSLKAIVNKFPQQQLIFGKTSDSQSIIRQLQNEKNDLENKRKILESDLQKLRIAVANNEEERRKFGRENKEFMERVEELETMLKKTREAELDLKSRLQKVEEDRRKLETTYTEKQKIIEDDKTRLEQHLRTMVMEKDRLVKGYVFVEEESRSILEIMQRGMKTFTERAAMLQRILQNLDLKSHVVASTVAHLNYAYIERLSWDWINECIGRIDELIREGQSTFYSLVAKSGGGRKLSVDECRRYICEMFYHHAVGGGRWDHVLRGLQRFYNLGYLVELSGSDLATYERAVIEIKHQESAAHKTLQQFDILPLSISFLEPVDEQIVSYVVYSEEKVINEYYPLWNTRQNHRRMLVLDATSWGYLNSKRELWGNQKARLIISK